MQKSPNARQITVQCFGYAVRVRGGGRLGGGWAGGGGLGEVTKCTVLSWIIRQRGWPPSPLLRKVQLKVAPLELPFVICWNMLKMLKYVQIWWAMLKCVELCWNLVDNAENMLKHVEKWWNTSKYVETYRNMLNYFEIGCNTLKYVEKCYVEECWNMMTYVEIFWKCWNGNVSGILHDIMIKLKPFLL